MAEVKLDVADRIGRLKEAQAAYDDAEAKYQVASGEKTRCVNNLNAAQKAVDEAMAQLKGAAPWGSNWHSQRNPPQMVA